jgi:hypothetical protein
MKTHVLTERTICATTNHTRQVITAPPYALQEALNGQGTDWEPVGQRREAGNLDCQSLWFYM